MGELGRTAVLAGNSCRVLACGGAKRRPVRRRRLPLGLSSVAQK